MKLILCSVYILIILNFNLMSQTESFPSELSKSQTPNIGFEAGTNYYLYSSDITWIQSVANSALKVMKSADGLALHFGIFLDYPLSRKIGLKFGANFDWVNFLNTKTGDLSVKTTDGQIFTGQEEMQFKITGLYSGLTVLLRCNITPNLYISGGPGFFLETGKFNLDFTETSLSSNIQYIDEKGNPTRSISCKLNLEKIQCLEKVYNTI